jgi:N-acetylglucosamine-6-phosphate deacetylase
MYDVKEERTLKKLYGNVVLSDKILQNATIVVNNGKIIDILSAAGNKSKPTDENVYILPGLVDIHNHGGMGWDYMFATEEAFEGISDYLVSHGVTSALCSSSTAPVKELKRFLDFFREYKTCNTNGCRFIGVHVEGPFISLKNKGAHPKSALLTPADGYDLLLEYSDIIKEITIAPELPGMADMIRDLRKAGIVISGGHDNAEPVHIEQAIEAGMTHTTHVYCAMSMIHMRNLIRYCGLSEYSLYCDQLTTEMIADNHHIPPMMAALIYKCKGAKKLCIVSDGISPGGMPEDGKLYPLGTVYGEKPTMVMINNGVAVMEDKSCYAGSVQALDQMIANLVNDAGVPLVDAVRMASLTPAEVIGMQNEIGSIEIGKRADFCIMDRDFKVQATISGGEYIYVNQ